MKKMILFAAAIMMAFGASAQMSLVKDLAKKATSSNPMELADVLTQIEPALENPESAGDVLTWYTAGKAAFGLYDEMYKVSLLQPDAADPEMMGAAVLSGYEYFLKALPLDSVPELNKDGSFKLNKDGSKKVKTKYSKEIVSNLVAHINDIARAADNCRNAEKWELAAAAYGYFADIASSPLAKQNNVEFPDSSISEIRFLQGFSQFYGKDYAGAYENCTKAYKMGYDKNNITGYMTSSLANLVQDMLDNKEYDKAMAFIDNAISTDAHNAVLYDIKGFTAELKDGPDAALPYYEKAMQVDPTYANGFADAARCMVLQAQQIVDDNPDASNNELLPKVQPLYDKAIPLLEKAIQLNPDVAQAKNLLDNIRYWLVDIMGLKQYAAPAN
jgi:tetratricopeptide (TPR) repeat protein